MLLGQNEILRSDCVTTCVVSSPLEQLSQSGTAIGPFRILLKYVENTKKTLNLEKIYCCGCAEESKGGDGDAAATEAHAVKGGNGEGKGDVDAAAALPLAGRPWERHARILRRRAKPVLLRRRREV